MNPTNRTGRWCHSLRMPLQLTTFAYSASVKSTPSIPALSFILYHMLRISIYWSPTTIAWIVCIQGTLWGNVSLWIIANIAKGPTTPCYISTAALQVFCTVMVNNLSHDSRLPPFFLCQGNSQSMPQVRCDLPVLPVAPNQWQVQ